MIALDAEEHLELVDLNQNQKSLGSRNVIKSDNFLKSKSDIESPENLPPRNIKNFEDHIIQNSHKDKVKIEVNAEKEASFTGRWCKRLMIDRRVQKSL